MNHRPRSDWEEIKEETEKDLRYTWKGEANFRSHRNSTGIKPHGRVCLFRPLRGLIIFAVFAFLFGCGNNDYAEDVDAIKARLDMVEERLVQLEKTAQRISPLEFQLKGLQESVTELERMAAEKPEVPPPAEKQSSAQNKVRHHEVRRGDTLYGIAQEYGLSVAELMRLNNLTKTQAIHPGQKLLITPGKTE
jgi:LysM repeat protein